jgi:hypothetical protein
MDTRTAANSWTAAWQEGWPSRDVERIAAVYVDGPVYSSHPFREPDTARGYVERAFGEEDLVEAWFGEPVVDGRRAAVEYWAILAEDGRELTLAGAAFLRFERHGRRVTDHRDYWTMEEGPRKPPPGWGR